MALVSIILPADNVATTIAETIESVQAQSFPDWELIIIDNSSSDGTGAHVEQYAADDARIRLIRRSEHSDDVARVRNQGIEAATGRLIGFLDAGDRFLSDKLQDQLDFMRAQNSTASATASRRIIKGKHKRILRHKTPIRFANLRWRLPPPLSTLLFDRAALGDLRFPEGLRDKHGIGLFLAITQQGHDLDVLNMDLARIHCAKDSLLRNLTALYRLYRHTGLTCGQSLRSVTAAFFATFARLF